MRGYAGYRTWQGHGLFSCNNPLPPIPTKSPSQPIKTRSLKCKPSPPRSSSALSSHSQPSLAVLWIGVTFITSSAIVPTEVTLDGGDLAFLRRPAILRRHPRRLSMSVAGIVDGLSVRDHHGSTSSSNRHRSIDNSHVRDAPDRAFCCRASPRGGFTWRRNDGRSDHHISAKRQYTAGSLSIRVWPSYGRYQ